MTTKNHKPRLALRAARAARERLLRVGVDVRLTFTGPEFVQLRYVAAADERRPELARGPLGRSALGRLAQRAMKLHLLRHGVEVLA